MGGGGHVFKPISSLQFWKPVAMGEIYVVQGFFACTYFDNFKDDHTKLQKLSKNWKQSVR
jgi:hypothetical protein